MKNIKIKLTLFFISLMCISSIISFFASIFFNNRIVNEMRFDHIAIANSIYELKEKTDLSIEDIVNITDTSMYDVIIVEDIDSIKISNEELRKTA